jgi:hypothetical protein
MSGGMVMGGVVSEPVENRPSAPEQVPETVHVA